MNVVKLKLSISKRYVNSRSGSEGKLVFSVLDMDRSGSYPRNFVCVLPRNLDSRGGSSGSQFCKIYGSESGQVAVDLLTAGLKGRDSFEVKDEIRKRLRALEPMHVVSVKCVVCGCVFEPKKYRYRSYVQRVCQECRNKNKPSQ